MGALEVIKLWLAIRPIKRWKERRAAKRAALVPNSPEAASANSAALKNQLEAVPAAEGNNVGSELVQSMARSALKVVGAALVTYAVSHGVVDAQASSDLSVALEALGGGVLTIAGLIWSHRTHKA